MHYIRTINVLLLSGFILFTACGDEDKQETKSNNFENQSKSSPVNITTLQLMKASLEGNLNIIEKAVTENVDLNQQDQAGRTPLMMAAFNGHSEIVQYLLDNGADFQATDMEGRSPLIFGASGPYPQTVKLLLEAGADPNKTDKKEGWSALMWAAAEGNEEVVQILLDSGADPNLKDKDDETALNFASSNGHSNVVKLLKQTENEK